MRVLEFQNVNKKTNGYEINNLSFHVSTCEISVMVCHEIEAQRMIVDMISGIMSGDSGQLTYLNRPIRSGDYKHLSKIGIVTKAVFFYENLTGIENLKLIMKTYKKFKSYKVYKEMLESIDEYFELLNMTNFKDTLVRKYSLGSIQKLKIIRSLMIDPNLLILDDPFLYLDSVSVEVIMEHLSIKCKNNGLSVLILSPTFVPLSTLSHKVSLIHKGKIVDTVSREELLRKQKSHIIVESKELSRLLMLLEKELSIFNYEVVNNEQVDLFDGLHETDKIYKLAYENKIAIDRIQFGYDSMENYFLNQINEDNNGRTKKV